MPLSATAAGLKVRRHGPIITPDMLPGQDGKNINGASIIKAPEWLPNRLGAYYLYFAHHKGKYIRLAFADAITGPWHVYAPGTLPLAACPFLRGHIASPDVHVDDGRRRIVMYFHGPARQGTEQQTFVAMSMDGLAFSPSPRPLGLSYARVFWHGGWAYGIFGAIEHLIRRSPNGLWQFEAGPTPFSAEMHNERHVRHVALQKDGETLRVFFTCTDDRPERIFVGEVDLRGDWTTWSIGETRELMRPETDYEGAALPMVTSKSGIAREPQNALRDPAIFEEDGRTWMAYSVAGEQGIALAELTT